MIEYTVALGVRRRDAASGTFANYVHYKTRVASKELKLLEPAMNCRAEVDLIRSLG